MTKIPPEHTAARALEESFRVLGEERAEVQGRRRRRMPRGTRRTVLIALTALMLVAVAATGTKVFVGDGGILHSDTQGLEGRLDPAPHYRQLAQASAPDPRERQPWGLRTFLSAKGDTCIALGRVVGGRLGVIRNGQFKELPTRTGGVCGALGDQHIVMTARRYAAATIPNGRTIVYGVVDRTVTGLRIQHAGGSAEPVR